jgi:hypothetical protein
MRARMLSKTALHQGHTLSQRTNHAASAARCAPTRPLSAKSNSVLTAERKALRMLARTENPNRRHADTNRTKSTV